MSDTQKSSDPAAKPGEPKPEEQQGMHKVDERVQEEAAEEREKSGGYD